MTPEQVAIKAAKSVVHRPLASTREIIADAQEAVRRAREARKVVEPANKYRAWGEQ